MPTSISRFDSDATFLYELEGKQTTTSRDKKSEPAAIKHDSLTGALAEPSDGMQLRFPSTCDYPKAGDSRAKIGSLGAREEYTMEVPNTGLVIGALLEAHGLSKAPTVNHVSDQEEDVLDAMDSGYTRPPPPSPFVISARHALIAADEGYHSDETKAQISPELMFTLAEKIDGIVWATGLQEPVSCPISAGNVNEETGPPLNDEMKSGASPLQREKKVPHFLSSYYGPNRFEALSTVDPCGNTADCAAMNDVINTTRQSETMEIVPSKRAYMSDPEGILPFVQ